jgi:hypothetical protein
MALDDVFFGTSCNLINNLNGTGKTSAIPSIVSLCSGGGTYTLNPQLSTVYGTIWKNSSGTTLNTGARTYTVSTTGTYYLCYDTIPGCYRPDTVNVINTLSVNIGNNQNLCNPVSTTLLTGVSVPPCSVTWFLNGTKIPGATGANYFVNTVGTYFAVVSAPGCAVATSNGVNITSSAATPNNAYYCGTSTVNLSVSPANSGKYKWWSDPTATGAGFLLQKGGSSINIAVSGTANFVVYAQDTSITKLTSGPSSNCLNNASGWSLNGDMGIVLNVSTGFILDSFSVYLPSSSGTLGTNIKNITTGVTTSLSYSWTSSGNSYVKVPIGYTFITGDVYTINFNGNGVNIGACSGSSFPQNYSPYFSFPQSYDSYTMNNWGDNMLPSAINWVIRTGTICARVPVVASSTCALDISYVNLFAYRKGSTDQLNWQFNGLNVNSYSLQRSSDGIIFNDLVSFDVDQKDITSYSTSNTGFPSAYYRIKVIDQNNKESYSRIQYVSGNEASLYSSLFPNPSQGGEAKIVSNFSMNAIEIIDRSGKQVLSFDLEGVNEYQLSSNLAQGVYFVRITGVDITKVISWVVLP